MPRHKGSKDRVLRKTRADVIIQQELNEYKCSNCSLVFPLSGFPKGRTNRRGQQRYAYCKTCHSDKERERRLKRYFNISVEEYDRILSAQGGGCAICKKKPKTMRLAVDHDHKTGLIRGLLCSFCNQGIAIFRDNIESFKNIITFLEHPPATSVLGSERFGIIGSTSNKAATRNRLNKNYLVLRKT